MNPPFSNQRLRTFAQEYDIDQEEKYIAKWVHQLQTQVLDASYKNSQGFLVPIQHMGGVGFYVFRVPLPKYGTDSTHFSIQRKLFSTFIPRIIKSLKSVFPEMRIQTDPLDTYLLLDWS